MRISIPADSIKWVYWACGLVILGVGLRLYGISANEFLFYDEGMYLSQNRHFLDLVAANPPHNFQEFWIILGLMFKAALETPKALWFFLMNLRVFLGSAEAWSFARWISAFAGIATIGLVFAFARRYFQSLPIALLSAAFLSVLPSHVFYSRLGMQESLSALVFLAGIYWYVFSRPGVSWRSCAAAILMGAVYLTNYRMIIAPLFILLCGIYQSKVQGQKFDARKFTWFAVVFFAVIFGLGGLYGGANTFVNFAWMFHQADESHAYRGPINFLSFPYYLFSLEGAAFGSLFFANLVFLYQRRWPVVLPFLLTLTQMAVFSFAAEKGARYLCVVLPFAAMAAAVAFDRLFRCNSHRLIVWLVTAGVFLSLIWRSVELARAHTDYGRAIGMVLAHDPQAKIISTQPVVESLFLKTERNITACPKDPAQLAALIRQGYRYLILDPQMYISWTADGNRFTTPLVPVLESVRAQLKPVAVLPHIDGVYLKRFVMDHNQDLPASLKFLKSPQGKGEIYIYEFQ